jgi:hypothetical protein
VKQQNSCSVGQTREAPPSSPQTPLGQHWPFTQLCGLQHWLPQQTLPKSQHWLPQISRSPVQHLPPAQMPFKQQSPLSASQHSWKVLQEALPQQEKSSGAQNDRSPPGHSFHPSGHSPRRTHLSARQRWVSRGQHSLKVPSPFEPQKSKRSMSQQKLVLKGPESMQTEPTGQQLSSLWQMGQQMPVDARQR